jgi:hypothetical protein
VILILVWLTPLSTKNGTANRSACNTILFGMSCCTAAISQIYKEQTLMAFAKPNITQYAVEFVLVCFHILNLATIYSTTGPC